MRISPWQNLFSYEDMFAFVKAHSTTVKICSGLIAVCVMASATYLGKKLAGRSHLLFRKNIHTDTKFCLKLIDFSGEQNGAIPFVRFFKKNFPNVIVESYVLKPRKVKSTNNEIEVFNIKDLMKSRSKSDLPVLQVCLLAKHAPLLNSDAQTLYIHPLCSKIDHLFQMQNLYLGAKRHGFITNEPSKSLPPLEWSGINRNMFIRKNEFYFGELGSMKSALHFLLTATSVNKKGDLSVVFKASGKKANQMIEAVNDQKIRERLHLNHVKKLILYDTNFKKHTVYDDNYVEKEKENEKQVYSNEGRVLRIWLNDKLNYDHILILFRDSLKLATVKSDFMLSLALSMKKIISFQREEKGVFQELNEQWKAMTRGHPKKLIQLFKQLSSHEGKEIASCEKIDQVAKMLQEKGTAIAFKRFSKILTKQKFWDHLREKMTNLAI